MLHLLYQGRQKRAAIQKVVDERRRMIAAERLQLQALKLADPDIKIEPTDDDTWKWSPSSVSIRRAKIDSQIWFEMLMLPPHAMAGSKYYACEVPSICIFISMACNPCSRCARTMSSRPSFLPTLRPTSYQCLISKLSLPLTSLGNGIRYQ